MHWTEIAGAVTDLIGFPIALYFVYFNQKSKYYKKTWFLVVIVVGFVAMAAKDGMQYFAKVEEEQARSAKMREKAKDSVAKGMLAASDYVFESPDGYRILIPAGYTYSKPAGTPINLLAIKNFDTTQTPALSLIVDSSKVTNEQFVETMKKGMLQKNSSTKFSETVRIKNGSTEVDRVDMSSTRDNGAAKAVVLFASNADKHYIVILGTREELYAAAKPEFERIVASFALTTPGDKPVAALPPAAAPTQAAASPQSAAVTNAVASKAEVPLKANARQERDVQPDAVASASKPVPDPVPQKTAARTPESSPRPAVRTASDSRRSEEEVPKRNAGGAARQAPGGCVFKPVMSDDDLAKCR